MEDLPDAMLQLIMSNVNNAKDVAACNCVSKRWKDSLTYIKALYFPRNSFKNNSGREPPDNIVRRMISQMVQLEELVVYSPFSIAGLASWLSLVGLSLRKLELRMNNNIHTSNESQSNLDCVGAARNLESLILWDVLVVNPPRWDIFQNLKNLEIIVFRMNFRVLSAVLRSCPYLTRLILLGCEGVRSVSIVLPNLNECKLDFDSFGYTSLTLLSPKIESLEVHGCSRIRVPVTNHLRILTIANNAGIVSMVDFGKLTALETLYMRAAQWSWHAIHKMLKLSSEVEHLYIKVEFTSNLQAFLSFPEIDFVDFFNSHPKLRKFDIHGAMFAALCQKNSLKHVDSRFMIPCLEEVVITMRSPLNAEQKMSTLESLLKYGKNLRTMVIRFLQMKSIDINVDGFFDQVCKFTHQNHKIVRIE